jgi:hypothetical protein
LVHFLVPLVLFACNPEKPMTSHPVTHPDTDEDTDIVDTDTGPSESAPPPPTTSFATDIAPILATNCAASGCHTGGGMQAGLALDPDKAYDMLVNAPAQECKSTGALRVAPGDPTNSYLVAKLRGTMAAMGCGGLPMPKDGTPVAEDQIQLVEKWISEGAPL